MALIPLIDPPFVTVGPRRRTRTDESRTLSDGEIAPRFALTNLGLSDGEIAPRFATNGLEGKDMAMELCRLLHANDMAPELCRLLHAWLMAPELCRLQRAVGNGRGCPVPALGRNACSAVTCVVCLVVSA